MDKTVRKVSLMEINKTITVRNSITKSIGIKLRSSNISEYKNDPILVTGNNLKKEIKNKQGVILNKIISLIYEKIRHIKFEGDYIKSIYGENEELSPELSNSSLARLFLD